ncbi:hypothetical protein [Streptomyces sp. NPDC014733]|uniref:hypothetical protein n=1 Tax=Streptomyces sp. NPDC014733 TaxID=3364885 RepID=UPI0036FADACA
MSENKGGVTTDKGCFYAKHETKFYQYNMDQLKAMVADAKPGKVKEVATNWKWIHDCLVGEDGRGGLRKEFDDAIKEVLEAWGGQAAEGFRRTAKTISDNIANAGPWAINMHDVMNGVEASLSDYKQKIDDMKKPTGTESNLDAAGNYALKVVTFGSKGGRDDSKANSELEAGKPTEDVLNGNSGELSEGKERQLQTAIIMEYLGSSYRSNVAAIGKPPPSRVGEKEVPPPGDTPTPPPFVPIPNSVMNPPKPSVPKTDIPKPHGGGYQSPPGLEGPRHDGISGGVNSPMPKTSTMPSVNTGLDGLGGGGAGGGGLSGTGGGLAGGAGIGSGAGIGGGSGAGAGTGSSSAGMPGGAGMIGGGVAGRGGAAGGAGARGGRAGMPGMGGAAGRGAGGAKGGAAAGRGSALAKQKGGVVGGAKGKTGGGAQGGSGLHRSRGGTQKGNLGGRRPAGMAGVPGANGAKGRGKNENGERPDYLVEDEETWTPERNVAPKVIE